MKIFWALAVGASFLLIAMFVVDAAVADELVIRADRQQAFTEEATLQLLDEWNNYQDEPAGQIASESEIELMADYLSVLAAEPVYPAPPLRRAKYNHFIETFRSRTLGCSYQEKGWKLEENKKVGSGRIVLVEDDCKFQITTIVPAGGFDPNPNIEDGEQRPEAADLRAYFPGNDKPREIKVSWTERFAPGYGFPKKPGNSQVLFDLSSDVPNLYIDVYLADGGQHLSLYLGDAPRKRGTALDQPSHRLRLVVEPEHLRETLRITFGIQLPTADEDGTYYLEYEPVEAPMEKKRLAEQLLKTTGYAEAPGFSSWAVRSRWSDRDLVGVAPDKPQSNVRYVDDVHVRWKSTVAK